MTTESSHNLNPVAAAAYGADSRTAVVEGERAREVLDMLTAPVLATPPEKAIAIRAILDRNFSVGSDAQNLRVLQILGSVGEVTAMELQRYADVRHAPARILQLKQQGHVISDRWVRQDSDLGFSHRTKAYTLMREAQAAEVVS